MLRHENGRTKILSYLLQNIARIGAAAQRRRVNPGVASARLSVFISIRRMTARSSEAIEFLDASSPST